MAIRKGIDKAEYEAVCYAAKRNKDNEEIREKMRQLTETTNVDKIKDGTRLFD